MSAPLPSFFARLGIAFAAFFRALGDAKFAALVDEVSKGGALPSSSQPAPAALPAPTPAAIAQAPAPMVPAPVPVTTLAPASANEGALHLLAIFQREGRLLDFCEEELAGFSDAAVGAAARLVHTGCRKALRENLELAPVRSEAEGAKVTLAAGFDARAIRLTGNVVGNPPFTGALKHHGWKASQVKFAEPPRGEAAKLLAPAEVELS